MACKCCKKKCIDKLIFQIQSIGVHDVSASPQSWYWYWEANLTLQDGTVISNIGTGEATGSNDIFPRVESTFTVGEYSFTYVIAGEDLITQGTSPCRYNGLVPTNYTINRDAEILALFCCSSPRSENGGFVGGPFGGWAVSGCGLHGTPVGQAVIQC